MDWLLSKIVKYKFFHIRLEVFRLTLNKIAINLSYIFQTPMTEPVFPMMKFLKIFTVAVRVS